MPLRIWVIGSRTSSAPSGNSIGAPAGATGAGARGAGGADAGPAEPLPPGPAGAPAGAGAAPPVRIVSTTFRTSSRVIRPPPPVPWIWAAERSCSRRSRRTAGVIRASGSATAGGAEVVARSGGRGHLGRSALIAAGGTGGHGRRRGGCLGDGLGRGRRRLGRGCRGRGRTPPVRGGLGRVPGAVVGRLDDRDLGVVRDRRAFLDEDLAQDALERRRHLGVDLVGDDLDERLVLRDMVARLLEPFPDRPLGNALAELGHRHLGHVRRSSEVRAASRGRAGSLRVVSPISGIGSSPTRSPPPGIHSPGLPRLGIMRAMPLAPVDGDR